MKVLLYHKQLTTFLAGGMFQPLIFVSELQRSCEVTLALNESCDIAEASDVAGIPIDTKRLKVVILDPKEGFLTKHPYMLSLRRAQKLKRLAKEADFCISTANVMDFGKPGHHFIYLLSQFGGHAFYDHLMQTKGRTGLRRRFRRLCTALGENVIKPLFGIRPLKKILADRRERVYPTSRYVEGIVRSFYGPFNSKVFYPPTVFEFTRTDVVRDPLSVIYVGRIFPPKRITDIIEIVARARELSGLDLTLRIAGKLTPIPYVETLKRLAEERPWLSLVGPVYGKEKEEFMLSAAYALHAEKDEAFGIAIAEYLKAGNIPLVPDTGGPLEIVDNPSLVFHTNEDAAQTLVKLLSDTAFREDLRRHCAERAEIFTHAAYMARQRKLLAQIVEQEEGH